MPIAIETATGPGEAMRPPVTSFLSGGGRGHGLTQRIGGSMGPSGFALKARGLAEPVGLPDFFIELHEKSYGRRRP